MTLTRERGRPGASGALRHARRDLGLLLLVLAYLATGLWMAWRMPGFAGPNEELHYEHVALLRRDLRLPDPNTSERMDERHQPPVYYLAAALAAWRHPRPRLDTDFAGNPHYLGTWRGNLNPKLRVDPTSAPLLYAARLTSLAFGLLGVLATWWSVRLLASPGLALLVAALLAFHPTWLQLGATAANDLPAAAMVALALALATRLLIADLPRGQGLVGPGSGGRPRLRDHAVWGLVFALALLTKANAVFVGLAYGIVWLQLWQARADRAATSAARPRRWPAGLLRETPWAMRAGAAALLGCLPPSLAWLVLNRARGLDATGVERSVPLDRLLGLRLADIGPFLPWSGRIWRSVWLDWSRGGVGLAPEPVYWLIGAVLLAAGLGWIRRLRAWRQEAAADATAADAKVAAAMDGAATGGALTAAPGAGLLLRLAAMHLGWSLAFLAVYLAVKALMLREMGFVTPEGRWILPLAPSLAWLTGIGLAGLAVGHDRGSAASRDGNRAAIRDGDRVAAGMAGGVALAGMALAFGWLPWLYPRAARLDPAAAGEALPPASIVYGEAIALESAALGELQIGRTSEAQLVWRALAAPEADASVSAQLLMPDGAGGWERPIKLDQQDSYPGAGSAPTGDWRSGERRADRVWLRPALDGRELDGPVKAGLGIWLVGGPGPAEVWPMTREGRALDWPLLAETVLRPASPPALPSAARLAPSPRFGDAVELAGLAWADGPAGGAHLDLWWRVLTPLARDYPVFVQVLGPDGDLREQADGDPIGGASPSSIWRAGDLLRDRRILKQAPPAGGALLLGFYDRATGARLEARLDGERLGDDAFRSPIP